MEHINPDFCMPYGSEDGKIRWRGYGIESITTFLDDVIDLIEGRMDLEELQIQRPSFQEALVSTMVIEAAHKSLNEQSTWQEYNNLK